MQLFVERVTAIVEDFELTDGNTPLVVEICRGLDGLPLAIEFAAPGVEVLGLDGLAARLDESLPLLGSRRRGRVARHRTMRAVIDWSYDLLNQEEQLFFRALGIFSGGFTMEAAAAVATNSANVDIEAIDRLADLVEKSLVVADVSGTKPRFRLLEAIRAYAIEVLDESNERQHIACRHAEYYRNLFERAEDESVARRADDWLTDYAQEIGNLRAALDWAFSARDHGSTALALTAAAAPLWMRLSLLEECRNRVQQALEALGAGVAQDPRLEMRLHAALEHRHRSASELGAAFTKALNLGQSLGDTEYQLRALRGLFSYHNASGRYREALPFAQKLHDLTAAGSDATDQLFGERMMGVARHVVGDQTAARRHLERVLSRFAAGDHGPDIIRSRTDSHIIRFHTDLRVSARMYLARVLWLQGFSEQAVRTAEMSVEEAQATGHALSLCSALALAACPIALWVGNLPMAAKYARELLDHSRRHYLPLWNEYGTGFHRVVALKSGDIGAGSPTSDNALCVAAQNVPFRFLAGLIELAEALTHAGRIVEGLAVVEAGIEQSEPGWLTPELLRLKGELLLLRDASAGAGTPKNLLQQALDTAREQGALSWELRAATSLARALRAQGRLADAVACLQPIYDRFTEGFGTADLVAAKQLLDDLSDRGNR